MRSRLRRVGLTFLAVVIVSLATPPEDLLAQPAHPHAKTRKETLDEAATLAKRVDHLLTFEHYDEAVRVATTVLELREKVLGANHRDVAKACAELALANDAAGHLDAAERYERRALAIREKALGPKHADTAESLYSLGAILSEKKDPAAVPFLQRALALREASRPPDEAGVRKTLNMLAVAYFRLHDLASAAAFWERALASEEKVFGPESHKVLERLSNLGFAYYQLGDMARAESVLARALAGCDKKGYTDGELLDTVLSNLGQVYLQRGEYAKSEPLVVRALALAEKAKAAPGSDDLALALQNLGVLYIHTGELARAEPLLVRALALREKNLGPTHVEVATTASNLGALYDRMGDMVRAREYEERALAIREKALGPDDPDVALSLTNLAATLTSLGEHERVEPMFQRALAIREKRLGPEHPDVADTLVLLANFYVREQDPNKRAEPTFLRALAIVEKSRGPEHPATGAILTSLASFYEAKGDWPNALSFQKRALALVEKRFGPDHTTVASALWVLANIYRARGDYDQAEPLYARVLAIKERALGAAHPETVIARTALGLLHVATGDIGRALSELEAAETVRESTLRLVLATGSEAQKAAYMTTLDGPTTAVVSLHAVWAPTDARARRLALLTVLRRKGRILDAMAHNAEALRGRLDPETKAIVDELAQVRAKLAAATAGSLGAVAAVPSPEARVALERDAQRLEAAASARSAEVSATEHAVTIESVAGAIPEGAALVEVVYYRPYNPKVSTTIATLLPARYAAYALWRSGESAWTDLGEAEPIDKAAAHVRDAFASPARTDAKDAARALDEKVGRPIRAMLGGSHEVLLALDGALQLVPFGALVMEDGKFFLERFAVTYVTTGRDLLRFGDRSAPRSSPLVVANPTFDVPGAPAGKPFTPLPGTDGEATRLAVLLPGAVVLRGEAATKAALTAAHGPRILHVATHGFFLDDASRDARNTRGLELDTGAASSAAVAARPNPLLRAGLGLAGANAVGDRSAGILTALEASGLDLWGTKLVVLSACETGIGEVHNGEGVYGLRRSFLMSGAETLVMSMWKVDDEATRDLMADYYGQLQRGGGRGEALRRAQLAMLVTPARAHPYFWASFIAAGNPATLDGGRDAPQSVAPGAGAKLESHGCACDVAQREGGGSGGAWVALTLGLALARRRRFPIH